MRKKYEAEVIEECDALRKVLEAAQHLGEVSPRTEDKIIAKGEKLSCRYMTAVLQDRGVDAAYVDLSDVINIDSDTILGEEFYNDLSESLAKAVYDCGAAVPVITGYFGNVPGGLLTQIGRGYTDLCAALVAVGLSASELQIWKEVDGIFTADPRKVPTARLLASVTPAEAAELTFYGSEVIHPFTMDQVIRASIPIRIKNVKNPRGAGTLIEPDSTGNLAYKKTLSTSSFTRDQARYLINPNPSTPPNGTKISTSIPSHPRRPTAVTIKSGITVLNVHSKKRTRAHGFLMSIFSTLDKHKLSVDLISSSEVHVSMALHSEIALLSQVSSASNPPPPTSNLNIPTVASGIDAVVQTQDIAEELRIESAALKGAVEDLSRWGDVDLVPNMAIVSLVGKELRSMTGISGRFLGVLGQERINVEMISQGKPHHSLFPLLSTTPIYHSKIIILTCHLMIIGASEINISCVIEERQANRALNVVHTNLFTFLD